jgi:hypothetical protein
MELSVSKWKYWLLNVINICYIYTLYPSPYTHTHTHTHIHNKDTHNLTHIQSTYIPQTQKNSLKFNKSSVILLVFASLNVRKKSMEYCHHSWILPLMHTFHPIWLTDMGVHHPNSTIYVPVINFVCIDVIFCIPHNWQLWNIPFTVCFYYQKPSFNCALLWVFYSSCWTQTVRCPWRSQCVI